MSTPAVVAGTMIGAFRVERLIGAGTFGAVYEATQPSLGRTVALRLIGADELVTGPRRDRFEDQQRRLASVYHPNLVAFYEGGEWEGGRFVATRFIRGARLSDLSEEGLTLPPGALESVAEGLRAAHRVGLVHGRVSADNILIEANGTAYLSDLGLGHEGSPEADLEALTAVITDLESRARSAGGRKARHRMALALAVAAAIATPALVLILSGDDEPAVEAPVPAAPGQTRSIGSSLEATETVPLGCAENPTPNTALCSFTQTRIDGTSIVVPRDGVVRGWAVRGASGDVSLQLVREGEDGSFIVGFSQPERITDPGPHFFTTDVSVGAGDRIGVGLGPGATIGSMVDQPGATAVRFDGRLTADPRPESGTVDGVELMIRADINFRPR